jgi:hypothetical protein
MTTSITGTCYNWGSVALSKASNELKMNGLKELKIMEQNTYLRYAFPQARTRISKTPSHVYHLTEDIRPLAQYEHEQERWQYEPTNPGQIKQHSSYVHIMAMELTFLKFRHSVTLTC